MKTDRKRQIARLDKLWSRAVLKRDNSICQKCGEFGDNPHHVIYKDYIATRHVLLNGLTLCTKCHLEEAHGNPALFELWIMKEYPIGFAILNHLKREVKPDLDKIEARLKEEQ